VVHFPSGAQVFHTTKKSGQVLTNNHPPVKSVRRPVLPPDLKRSLREAITYFTLVSRYRIHGEYIQFSTCIHFTNFAILYLHNLFFYLLSLIVLESVHFKLLTFSTKIKRQLDFYEVSVIYLNMKARVHNMYFDTTKF